MATEYEKVLSPTEITALARRNHVVRDVLDSFDLAEESSISPWQLMVIVSELVKYCERVTIGGTDNQNKEYNRESILRLAKTDFIVNQCLNGSLNPDMTIDWEKAMIMATVFLAERNAMLTKHIVGTNEKLEAIMQSR